MNPRTLMGIALILVGALFLSNMVSLTVIGDDLSTIKVNSVYPDGTEDAPLEIVAGQRVHFQVEVTFCRVALPSYWTAYVTVDNNRVDLQCTYQDYRIIYMPEMGRKVILGEGTFEADWTAPQEPGVYELVWVLDAGKLKDQFSTFVKIPGVEGDGGDDDDGGDDGGDVVRVPEGYFIIEGTDTRSVQESSTTDPALDIVFIPTNNADVISDVYVTLERKMDPEWSDEVHLMKTTSGRYTGTYQLTIGDEYTIHGYVGYDDTTDMKMSFKLAFSPEQDLAPDGFFTINGAEMEDGGLIYVNESDVEIRFYATKNVQNIQRIYVQMSKYGDDPVMMTWDIPVDTRTLTIELPSDGIYSFSGYVEWEEGAIHLVHGTIGYEGVDEQGPSGLSQLLGIIMIGAGAVMLVRRKP